jgi:hypothetical protein
MMFHSIFSSGTEISNAVCCQPLGRSQSGRGASVVAGNELFVVLTVEDLSRWKDAVSYVVVAARALGLIIAGVQRVDQRAG